MRNQITGWYFAIKSSFWLIPGGLALLAILGAPVLLNIDEQIKIKVLAEKLPGPMLTVEGARAMLSTIASAMITVATLILSMTLIALTMLSQQLGPRILQVFMEQSATKFTLGVFLSVFIFSMAALGATGTGEKGEFVPLITTYVACALALFAFGTMIHFVQTIATSIQADVVVKRLGAELNLAIESELERGSQSVQWLGQGEVSDPPLVPDSDKFHVVMPESGYVEGIDEEGALALAINQDTHITLLCRPGHYVLRGAPAVRLDDAPEDFKACADKIHKLISLGPRRTRRQQIEFEIHALVEVALRALSPGINDPFTAITCIDHLTDALRRLLKNNFETRALVDEDGCRRVTFYPTPFSHYLDTALLPIRQTAPGNTVITLKLLDAINALCLQADKVNHLDSLAAHAEMVQSTAELHTRVEQDLTSISERFSKVRNTIEWRRALLREKPDSKS